MCSLARAAALATPLLLHVAQGMAMTVEADDTGAVVVLCSCRQLSSGCATLPDGAWDGDRHRWVQLVFLRKGVPTDLAQACRGRRDEPGRGGGRCCDAGNQELVHRFYEGTVAPARTRGTAE